MILFDSDYQEGCHPAILKELYDTNFLQTPGYGRDSFCDKARAAIRALCSAPDADVHFLIGGTQTNVTVISSVLRPHQGVLCASTGHINVHETGAVEHSGHKVLTLPSADGKLTADSIRDAMKEHFAENMPEHTVQPGMAYISFPTELGTIYSLKELEAISAVCREWGIPLFIDGARLGSGLAADGCDVTLADIASLADIFYIGGTKLGTLFGEAVVICNEALKKDFRYLIKLNGGMLAKGRLLGIQFSALLKDGLYFQIGREENLKARRIADAFRAKGFGFLVESPTNQIFPILPADAASRLAENFSFEVWSELADGRIATRFCTSWATTDAAVASLVSAVSSL